MKTLGSLSRNSAARRHRPGSPRWFALGCAGWLALACAAVPLPAQSLLFAQFFSPSGPRFTSESDFQLSRQTADSFSLTAQSAVTRVRWYGDPDLPNVSFIVRFFADAGGSPASTPFYEQSVTPVQDAAVVGVNQFTANLSPAVVLDPGVTYYISIVENTYFLSWSWVFANQPGTVRKANVWTRMTDAMAWRPASISDPSASNKLAFELYGFVGADVGVGMVADPDPVRHGPNLTYAITVTNHGFLTAKYVIVEDVLPIEVAFKKVRTPGTAFTPRAGSTGTVLINLGDLAPGMTAQISIDVKIDDRNASSISNTVHVSSTTFDPTPLNNTATTSTVIQK